MATRSSDWTCGNEACGFLVWGSKQTDVCPKCRTVKGATAAAAAPTTASAARPAAAAPFRRNTDWTCPNEGCGFLVWGSKNLTVCPKCATAKA